MVIECWRRPAVRWVDTRLMRLFYLSLAMDGSWSVPQKTSSGPHFHIVMLGGPYVYVFQNQFA